MLERLEKRVGDKNKDKTERAISVIAKAINEAKIILNAKTMAGFFDYAPAKNLADLTNAWISLGEKNNLFPGHQYKKLREELNGILKVKGAANKYARQVWRTEMVSYVMQKLSSSPRKDKAQVMEKVLASQIVGPSEDEPFEALTLAMWLDPKIKNKDDRKNLAGSMEASKISGELGDLETLYKGYKFNSLKVVVGGEFITVPQQLASGFKFKNMYLNEEQGRIYGQMENGCKGNLVIIEVGKKDAAPQNLQREPPQNLQRQEPEKNPQAIFGGQPAEKTASQNTKNLEVAQMRNKSPRKNIPALSIYTAWGTPKTEDKFHKRLDEKSEPKPVKPLSKKGITLPTPAPKNGDKSEKKPEPETINISESINPGLPVPNKQNLSEKFPLLKDLIHELDLIEQEAFHRRRPKPSGKEYEKLSGLIRDAKKGLLYQAIVENWPQETLKEEYKKTMDNFYTRAANRTTPREIKDWLKRHWRENVSEENPGLEGENKFVVESKRKFKPADKPWMVANLNQLKKELRKELIDEESYDAEDDEYDEDEIDVKLLEFIEEEAAPFYIELFTNKAIVEGAIDFYEVKDDFEKRMKDLYKRCHLNAHWRYR